MLRLPPFEYRRPRTAAEAVEAHLEADGPAMYIAGGTDLVPNLKRRQFEPSTLIGLRSIRELQGAGESNGDGLVLGAGMTLREVAHHQGVASDYPALVEAAFQVANPQIQRMGTLGGNLCVDTRCNYYNQTHEWRKSIGFCMKKDGDICLVAPGSGKCWAISSSDTAPVMMALGAQIRLTGADGEREIPVGALYRDDGIDYMTKRDHEVLTGVRIPPAAGLRSTYVKVRRRGSFDFPILGVAAALRIEEGVIRDARLVLGAVHTHPVEVPEVEELVGEPPDREAFDAVGEAATRRATPLDNADLTLYWRKRVTRVNVRRALSRLAGLDE